MAQKVRSGKVNLNFAVSPAMAERFREVTQNHFGKLSLCFEAAMAMFMAAHPEEQGKWLKRVFDAGVDDAVARLLVEFHQEQAEKISRKGPSHRQSPSAGQGG